MSFSAHIESFLSLKNEFTGLATSELLPASSAASVQLLDKALFQAEVGGGKCSVCSGGARARLLALLPPPLGN